MGQPKIPDTRPIAVELKEGQTVSWCSCGRSKSQPYCDGSHRGTSFRPVSFTAKKRDTYYFCQCKHSGTPPLCDGSHKQITQEQIDASNGIEHVWYKVVDPEALLDDEVRTVQAGKKSLALVYHKGKYAALDNACPHQGGPLGEGSIECESDTNCWLRCPWHGWDFDPLTGESPEGFGDGVETYPVEVRDDGIYVQLRVLMTRQRTVSDLMVETMQNWGVRSVFGMVGHSNLGLADAMRVRQEQGALTYFGIRHEGAASFACSGYAKLSGKPAACLSIAGPGATNLLTGLWDAKVDRAPVLALTGQVNTQVLGPGAFQEIDLADAFSAVTAFSQTVLSNSKHAELMNLAIKHAVVERDVAHLIFPDEVQQRAVEDDAEAGQSRGRLAPDAIAPAEESVELAVNAINSAMRPVIIVGYGARDAMGPVMGLAERLQAPVLTTFKAKGQIPDAHPLAAGVLGRSGTPVASWCMNESDLLIVLGASFSNHTGIASKKRTIQVDFERMALGKFHPVDIPVWGEIGVTMELFQQRLAGYFTKSDARPDLKERWGIWREEKARRAQRGTEGALSSAAVFHALSELVPANAVIAVDVGNNTYSFGRYFECKQQRVLMSGYLGSIGFSFPAAMGAWAATQDIETLAERPVVSISGDGGFGQYLAEFTTAVKYDMNITHILLNNHELGKITKEQKSDRLPVWQTGLHNPDFARFASNCGGFGIRVERLDQLEPAMRQALARNGPSLVEIMTDAELV